ncbi:MAG: putative toxin-antitoxin system toxin component, PIN family [Vicinamibacterales bacterium]
MLRAVLDANVFVSAYVRPEGPPGQIVDFLLRDGPLRIVMSEVIIEETLRALRYPKVLKAARSKEGPELWFEDLIVLAELVSGEYAIPTLSEDPDDDKYVAAAVEGRASFVVSGDPDLLTIGEHAGVRIVSPRSFLDLL